MRAFLSKGFRPFFLLAAIHAVSFLPLWLAVYTGHVDAAGYLPAADWHGHEMIFGFTLAVMAGFLLTAVSNWTGRETATGGRLAFLAGLWLAGRLAVTFAAVLPPPIVAAVDLAFVPALAIAVGRPLLATGNRRNLVFLGILSALFAANLFMHLQANGVGHASRPALLAALDVVVLVALIIGGRIIPAFTRNATGEATRSIRWVERIVLPAMVAVGVTTLVAPGSLLAGGFAGATGVLVLVRMRHWSTGATFSRPILWVLHLGHAWIGVGLLLRAAAAFWPGVPSTAATHALTLGPIGTLTLGMMTRVALGHTGRPLRVARPIVAAYGLLTAAVVLRALLPVALPALTVRAYVASGIAWTTAFALYAIVYLPILTAPRATG